MKKIDKLILTSFIGPFILTFLVVVFILLLQTMLKYFDDFFGKGIDFFVFIEMFFYFALNTAPVALPLAVLLSSLMTFGNLGEHYELTAIKSSGISLIRILAPIFVFVVVLSISAFFFNDRVVPKANLSAYSLLWDIRQKKPTLQFIQGAFYNGLDGYSVKVDKKFPENENLLKGLTIYDHTQGIGNVKVIMADSAVMKTINQERNLSIQMFNGNMYFEEENQRSGGNETFTRNKFQKMTSIFDLKSFQMDRTRKEMFASNKQMKNVKELSKDADSIRNMNKEVVKELTSSINPYFAFHNTPRLDTFKVKKIELDSFRRAKIFQLIDKEQILSSALNNARTIKSLMAGYSERFTKNEQDASSFDLEKNSKYTQSFACLVMFLIGAPLGAIIKKGGLGLPVLISIAFFIAFYVLTIISQKWAKGGLIEVVYASWAPNAILLPIGLFFLKQARNDARLFEADAYSVIWNNFIARFRKKK